MSARLVPIDPMIVRSNFFPDHSNSWSEGGGADHPAAGQRRQLRLGDRRRRLHRADAARAQEGPQPGRKAQGHLPKG